MAIGGSITSATQGSVLFAGASGVLAQDNANFFFDDTNNRLGIGTATPQVSLSVVSSGDNYGLFIGPNAGGTTGQRLKLGYFGTGNYSVIQSIQDGTNATNLILQKDGGNIGINTTTVGSQLSINGNVSIGYSASTAAPTNGLQVAGQSTFADTITVTTGTTKGIKFAGTKFVEPTNDAAYTQVLIQPNSGNKDAVFQFAPSGTNTTSVMEFYGGSNTAITTNRFIFKNNNGLLQIGGDGAALPIAFISTVSNEIARFDASRNFGLGTTTIGSKLQVNGNAAIGYSASTAAPTNGLAVSGSIKTGGTSGDGYPKQIQVITTGSDLSGTVSIANTTGMTLENTTSNVGSGSGLWFNNNGIYSGISNYRVNTSNWATQIRFYTHPSPTTNQYDLTLAATIDESQNLGLNTTTIGSRLQVNGNAAIGYSASTAAPTNGLAVSGNTGIGTNTPTDSILGLSGKLLDVTGTAGSAYKIHLTTAGYGELSIAKSTNGNYFDSAGATVVANNDIIFRTGATVSSFSVSEVLRLTGSGNVGVGTSAIGSKLQVNGNAAIGYSASTAAPTNGLVVAGNILAGTTSENSYGANVTSVQLNGVSGSLYETRHNGTSALRVGSSSDHCYIFEPRDVEQRFSTNGTLRMTIGNGGVVTIANLSGSGSRAVLADSSGVLSAPVSDISVKENVKPIGYGLKEISKMNPVWFEFTDDYKNYGEGRQNGNIAQEMAEIIPEAVFTTPSTGKMGINYDQLHAVYIKSIQELEARIKQLEKQLK